MNRVILEQTNSLKSESSNSVRTTSTTRDIKNYINNTNISDVVGNQLNTIPEQKSEMEHKNTDLKPLEDELNEFNLNIEVNNSNDNDEPEDEPNGFQKNVKYLPNKDFYISNESFPMSNPNSIPNTFKYKSFPNAKTKSQLGMNAEIAESLRPTVKDAEKTSALDKTPDWMPSELNGARWDNENEISDLQSSVRIRKNPSLNFQLPSTNNSIIHNSKTSNRQTPDWKKAKENFDNQKRNNLQHVFLNFDKSNLNSNSMSLTLSTPYNSIKQQIPVQDQQLITEHIQNGQDSNISPLKLFSGDFNTFTKGKLSEVLYNLKSAPPPPFVLNDMGQNKIDESPQENSETRKSIDSQTSQQANTTDEIFSGEYTSNVMPKLKTKNLDNDIESKFKMKANNIFDNIQKRGNLIQPSRNLSLMNTNANMTSTATATATSTPKLHKINNIDDIDNLEQSNEYSSFSSGFEEESTQFQNQDISKYRESNSNEYTSMTNSGSEVDVELRRLSVVSEPVSSGHEQYASASKDDGLNNTFTYENVANTQNAYSSSMSSVTRSKESNESESYNMELEDRIRFLENQLANIDVLQRNMQALANENEGLKEELNKKNSDNDMLSIDEYDLTVDNTDKDIQDFKMKRVSQLKLQNTNLNATSQKSKGTLRPNAQLPSSYNNMILDEENHRWILRENKENYLTSLDEIEDLISDNEKNKDLQDTITSHRKEVSFHLPHSEQVKSSPNHNDDLEITRASQIDEISFSQQQKKLVSVVTENLMDSSENWNKIIDMSLVNENLSNVKDLKKFLPNLLKLNISSNQLKYLKGLPSNLINLNVANNQIENLTSFKEFLDLQNLNLSNNSLTNCNALKYNIHLTKLNLANNQITSIDGINNLTNLVYLDLSINNLSGSLDLLKFNFDNLQELNLSENKLNSVEQINSVSNLRVLNLNENRLTRLHCHGRHKHLKKLLVKFNNLKELDYHSFPFLRVLRIDGNKFRYVSGLLKYLEELSAKCQDSSVLLDLLNSKLNSLKVLDLSGNTQILNAGLQKYLFLNVNRLTLSALLLQTLPAKFGDMFPNLTEVNLNFNKLTGIEELQGCKHLRKVYLLSNCITKVESIVKGLEHSRSILKVLDLRLNAVNIDFYPFVFNPHELDGGAKFEASNLPIELENLDDIENFSIHYETLNNNHRDNDWSIRDELFTRGLSHAKINRRLDYLTLLINFFPALRKLDGSIIDMERRREYEQNLRSSSQ